MLFRLVTVSLALAPAALTLPLVHQSEGQNVAPLQARAINPLYADNSVAENVPPHEPKIGHYDGIDYVVPGSRKRAVNPKYAQGVQPEQSKHEHQTGQYDGETYVVPGSKRHLGSQILEDVDFALYFPRPAAINPIYQNHSSVGLYRRADSGPLYGNTGQPQYTDVHQTTNPDCGFSSFLAAAVYSDPAWITSKVEVSGDYASASSAEVDLFNYQSYAPGEYTITRSQTERDSDVDPATGIWRVIYWHHDVCRVRAHVRWPGAYNHAALASGMNNDAGRLGPIGPWEAIAAITGMPAMAHKTADPDEIFDLAVTAGRAKTPMTLQTVTGGAGTLVDNHAYALLGGSGAGAERKIQLYNPWGEVLDLPVDSVAADTLTVWSVKGNAVINSPESGNGEATSTTKDSTVLDPSTSDPTSNRQARPTPTQVAKVWNAGANAIAITSSPPLPPQDNSKADENGVVWVTEVETVFVTA